MLALVLKYAGLVSTVFSLLAFLGALCFLLLARKKERSIREVVEGDPTIDPRKIVEILKTFDSDDLRLKALERILGWDRIRSQRLLEKLRDNIDVQGMSFRQEVWWRNRLLIAGTVFLVLAALGYAVERRERPEAAASPAIGFGKILRSVPPDQRASLIRFLPESLWTQPVTPRSDLPKPDWSGFKIDQSSVQYDLALWQPFAPGGNGLKSPVLVEKVLTFKKLDRRTDSIRLMFGTEGQYIVAGLTSPQDYQVESGISSGMPQTTLSNEVHLVVDVRHYPDGQPITVRARSIMWNGLLQDDPWLCLVSYATGGRGLLSVLAPPDRKLWHLDYCKYPDSSGNAISGRGDGTQLVGPEGRRVLWTIPMLVADCVYEVRWSFNADRPTDPPCEPEMAATDSARVTGPRAKIQSGRDESSRH